MKHYYFDTSALVKIYHREAGTADVLPIYKSQERIMVSEVGKIEFLSTISRRYREQDITHDVLHTLQKKFLDDPDHRYDVLRFSSLVVDEAWSLLRQFAETHALKTLDSLQFAFLKTYGDQETVFVCADKKLIELVKGEGFHIIFPG